MSFNVHKQIYTHKQPHYIHRMSNSFIGLSLAHRLIAVWLERRKE